jgi:hypothetical protein
MKHGTYILRSSCHNYILAAFENKKKYRKYISDERKKLNKEGVLKFTIKETEKYLKESEYLEFVKFY